MSMIQEELVREAIVTFCFPLVQKQRKGEKIKGLQSSQRAASCNSASIHTVQRRKQSAQDQLIAIFWLVKKGLVHSPKAGG